MRIAIGGVMHESNTFANTKTTIELFKKHEWAHREQIFKNHNGVRDYLGGMIDKGNELGVEIIPTFSAYCNPSGVITKHTFNTLKDELIESVRLAGDLDAICLALHGGGVSEEFSDIEGELLTALRNEVGRDIPIVATLDLHGNLTDTMLNAADALMGVNYYPHTDAYDRGLEALDLTVKIVKKQVEPVMSLVKIPLLVFPSTSYQSPAKDINELCWKQEEREGIIDCTFFHGFARADIPETGASVLTITDGNEVLAKNISENIAHQVWNLKEQFIYNYPAPDEGIQQALLTNDSPIVINETNDNPGSGAPGDGTHLLRALIERNTPLTCFGSIYDPGVVDQAHQAGVGITIDVELGGKTDNLHGTPLSVQAYVKNIADGQFIRTSPMFQGTKVNLGKTVRLQIGNVDVIVCSVNTQTLDEQLFLLHGIDVTTYKIVALKSCQHFRAAFRSIAKQIITVDSPGISTSNPSYYDYQHLNRPIYPLDTIKNFYARSESNEYS